ncbi:MAG: 30S ribosomal protein S4 [Candidatus Vogelbacteria bacterium]|jgi:small subunit ribosomal protein S4|nr:30S ribosomal protein S4 [Candidatus Vogelbacteria bacterium]
MRVGPKYKIARRLGERVFPKTQTTKFTVSGSDKKPKGKRGRGSMSEYGSQLIEKQKARYTYGITEKQFSGYIKKARIKKGNPADEIFKSLETRLDNVVFRMGLASSRAAARQMVSHGHILLNNRRLTIPSAIVRIGDIVTVRPQSKDKPLFNELDERLKTYTVPTWISFDTDKREATIKALPTVSQGEINLNFGKILEFYSRV